MSRKKSIYLIVILLGLFTQQTVAQISQISGVKNRYTAIDSILCFDYNNVDSLVVASVADFKEGDTVMIYITKGASILTDTISGGEFGDDDPPPGNTGKYALLIITEIIGPRNLVVLNATVTTQLGRNITPLKEGEQAQLIRVPSYRNAVVTSAGVRPLDWDPVTGTGGVVAMFVHGVLELNGDIDASGRGFRGARGSTDVNYNGDCSSVNLTLYDSAFYLTGNVRAGLKGEGITNTGFDRMRGRAKNINGGGGGNGKFSGGGGGSNWNFGGKGGDESDACGPGVENPGGGGGAVLSGYYYKNFTEPLVPARNTYDRIFFGGGGGTGTGMAGRKSSDGGNGGGIVIIVADSIKGNNRYIRADGASAASSQAGGGGGGGGGSIVLEVSGYKTTLNLSAKGGDGGNTNHATERTGPGGGGGGGGYWLAGSTWPVDVKPIADVLSQGKSGKNSTSTPIPYGASDGAAHQKKSGLQAPLRGFLFNSVPSHFTVCSDQRPGPIQASVPKGGDPTLPYAYTWIDSSSTQQFWQESTLGTSNSQNFTFNQNLSDTVYFRRIVTNAAVPLPDTSFRIAVYVHPAITGNTISAPDTVCAGNRPMEFFPAGTIGGGPTGGSYSYLWQKDEGSGLNNASGPDPINGESYQAPGLSLTTDFARIAYAGVCVDTSNSLRVKVWEPLTNNDITPFDSVCYNTELPDQFTSMSGPPTDGDQGDIRYQWFSSLNSTDWSIIGGQTSQSFQSPALTQTTYFRRVVLSGSDDACRDTSEFVEVLNIPEVASNTISETQTVCTGDQAALLTGSDPSGGYLGQYSYQWEARTASTGWTTVTGVSFTKIPYDAGIMDGDTTWYRRAVGSGGMARNVCISYSNLDTIHVLPSITNNVITTVDDIKCQDEYADLLNGATPGGGATLGGTDNTRLFRWEVATGQEQPDTWVHPGSGAVSEDYTDPDPLNTEHDRWYQRIVFSGPGQVCVDTSNLLQVTVHTGITLNTIEAFDSVCFADSKVLLGSSSSGEPSLLPVYTWRDLDSGNDIPGSDQEEFTTAPFNLLGKYHYERAVSIGECTDTSNAMQITVMQLPGGMLTDNAFKACEQDLDLAINLNMDLLNSFVRPWEVTLKNGVETGIGPLVVTGDGTIPVTLETSEDSMQFYYEIESITYSSVGGRYTCTAPVDSISGVVPIHVFRVPEAVITVDGAEVDNFEVCSSTVLLVADPDHGSGSWSSSPAGTVNFNPTANPNEYLAFIPDSHDAYGNFTFTFTSEAGDCAGEDLLGLHYFEMPEPPYVQDETIEIFVTTSVTLRADPPSAGTGEWTVEDESVTFEDPNAPVTMAYGLQSGPNIFSWNITNGVCPPMNADVVVVIQNDVGRYEGFSPNGDMTNEYYIMQGLPYADEFSISFFNALGKTVRTVTHENVGEMEVDPALISNGLQEDEMVVWDGRASNGNLVPSGTYYYVVTYSLFSANVRDLTYKGYIVVQRD